MNFGNTEYSLYREYIHYMCKYYRKLLYVYNAHDGTVLNYYKEILDFGNPALTAFFYNASRKAFDFIGSEEFVRGSHIEILFYTLSNSILQFYNKRSFGRLCDDALSRKILSIWSDYQYLHKYFVGTEDDGYYELVGVYNAQLSNQTSSNQYTNHKKYDFAIQPNLYASKIPTNGKYWGYYIFIAPDDFPATFYTRSIYVLPDGTEETRYTTWEVQQDGISRAYYIYRAIFNYAEFPNKRKAIPTAVSGSALPSGTQLSRITEIHIPDTYIPPSGAVQLQAHIPSAFYPGGDQYASIPDDVYFLFK